MQKNKFIHEDIKAVCSSAAKKLVAMGLVVAVGGTGAIGGSYRFIASAQQNIVVLRRHRICLVRNGVCVIDIGVFAPSDGILHLTSYEAERLRSHLTQPGSSVSVNGHVVEVTFGPNGTVHFSSEDGFTAEAEIVPLAQVSVQPLNYRPTALHAVEGERVTHSAENRQLIVTDDATIAAEGANRVNAGADSTIYSVSSNLFTHDGMGGGIIDGGDIEFSGFTEERMTRDVTVNEANSLTVAPGIPTRIQNGTEFTMGETLQETLENLQRAMGLPLGRERNAKKSQSTNCVLKFIIPVIVALWSFSIGSLFGGSGGSQ